MSGESHNPGWWTYTARILADERERIAAEIEAAWTRQCGTNRNPVLCESCRAYEEALVAVAG